jgi:ribosomal protein L37AE/L43A
MDKRQRIEDARRRDVCPECEKPLTDRVGTGTLADGVFCSLECQAKFHHDYFEERRDLGIPTDN